jgi:hypothetical protein
LKKNDNGADIQSSLDSEEEKDPRSNTEVKFNQAHKRKTEHIVNAADFS